MVAGGALRGGGMRQTVFNALMSAIIMLAITGAVLIIWNNNATKPAPAPQTQAQKFRFGEQCPDGLRVEYVSTYRLPKAVVCQQPVGE